MRVDTSWAGYLLDTQIQQRPLTFIRSGIYYYSSGGIGYRSSEGDFWESNPDSATNARVLSFNSTGLNPQNANTKGNGFSIRCLVR